MTENKACFTKHVRLLNADEFSRVFKNRPLRSSDRYLTILAVERAETNSADSNLPLQSASGPRLGLAISKKNVRRAVDRNRLKRLIRESFRLNQHELPVIDLVIMAKPEAKDAENQQILHSLQQHWKKLAQKLTQKLTREPSRDFHK